MSTSLMLDMTSGTAKIPPAYSPIVTHRDDCQCAAHTDARRIASEAFRERHYGPRQWDREAAERHAQRVYRAILAAHRLARGEY